ncbi:MULTISPECIES: FTR1 family iron permease [unclassified Microcoleus]|uniref:FTR1 family iron permease n=1 Tax=unclassified Microcoleus TaxID=2642155 RepID=UPI002FD453F9
MNFSEALPTFVITLREGVEAALVVGIVLACLKKSGQSYLSPWVYGGVAVGLIASALIGVLFGWTIQILSASNQPFAPIMESLLEASFGVLAIAMLSWMLLWMTKQARFMKAEVEGAVSAALTDKSHAGWGVFSLILIAVLREGFETVLFVVAKFQQGILPALGALGGILSAAGIGVLLFKWGVKINIRLFFKYMGILLLFIVAGLVVSTLGLFDTAVNTLSQANRESAGMCFYYERFVKEHSCILGPMVWNTSKVLPQEKFPGLLLSAMFGYTDKLYLVQGFAYFVFLITVGGIYLQSLSGRVFFPIKSKNSTNEIGN